MRITEGFLKKQVCILNKAVGIENPEWNTIGAYRLNYENNGVTLHKIISKSGGVENVFRRGHMPKRELLELIFVYEIGIFEGIKLCE